MNRASRRILLVEDSDADAFLVEESLTADVDLGFSVHRCRSLAEAEDALAVGDYAVVLYDLGLPDARGLPGFRRLAEAAEGIPVVIVTGSQDDLAADALAARAQDVLPKSAIGTPWLPHALVSAIERHRLLVQVEARALRDPLTGLHNRRGLAMLADQVMRERERTDIGITLLYLDVDSFKAANDRFGHAVGDAVLQQVAERLEEGCRSADVAARLGGDELVVLVTSGQEAVGGALRAARRVRQTMAGLRLPDGQEVRVSVGMAHRAPGEPCTLEELLDEGDADMYRDKLRARGDDRAAVR